MYYRLQDDPAASQVHAIQTANQHLSLMTGEALAREDIATTPFTYELYEGGNPDAPRPERWGALLPGACLMHADLVRVLRDAGADNLQAYPAVIRAKALPREVTAYLAVNVVGLLACAARGSFGSPVGDMQAFDRLVIDPARCHGLRLFRLAESPMEIVVDAQVARAVAAAQLRGVVLAPAR